MSELSVGDVFAGCRVEALIGRGGMGVVYRAVQLDLGRAVALKVLAADRASDPDFRERFQRESRMAAAIDHPNVVPVHGAGESADGQLYIVMRFVPGSDLHELLRRAGRLEAGRAAAIVAQIASALDAAHAAGLVHRDVKPGNVLLTGGAAGGGEEHAYLSDFGLTRQLDPDTGITESGQWIGTIDFASPEQLHGERLDARSDVYSLGCVLYAALTGGPPFPRGTVPATLLAHLNEPPPRPSLQGAPADLDRVVARALAKDPDDRYPSAGDLARAALGAARGEPVTESERSVAIGGAAPPDAADMRAARAVAADDVGDPTGPTGIVRLGPDRTRIAPRPPEPAARGLERPRRRGRAAILAIGAAIVALLAVAVVLATDPFDGGVQTAAGNETALTSGEVRAIAESFADAYETEDATALRRLLTTGVERVLPTSITRGRQAIVTAYQTQFRDNRTRSYELESLDTSGGRTGRATATYRVRRDGADALEGKIVLGVVRDRRSGEPRIALIALTPRT